MAPRLSSTPRSDLAARPCATSSSGDAVDHLRLVPSVFGVHQQDARNLGRLLDLHSAGDPLLTCTITSPPYANLKNYGSEDQIGWGQTYDEYLVELRRVFRSIFRHTKLNGSMWVIADTLRGDDSRSRQLEPLPFQLATEAADAGWILRETIIWQKDKSLPWSSGGRLRNTFEYVLLFVKSPNYKFHIDRLRDPTELSQWWVKWPERFNPHGRVPTNIWEIPIPVQGSWKATAVQHACPLPPDLVERLLFLSTDPGDVVLDPFAGTGVVIAEAERLGRKGIGLELNALYVEAFSKYVRPEIAKRNTGDRIAERAAEAEKRRDALLKLRALKYPKLLVQRLAKVQPLLPAPFAVSLIHHPFDSTALSEPRSSLKAELIVAVNGDNEAMDDVSRAAKEAEQRAPLSKFGMDVTTCVVTPEQMVERLHPRKLLWLYEAGRTWSTTGRVDVRLLERVAERGEHLVRGTNYRYPPIVSNLHVAERP